MRFLVEIETQGSEGALDEEAIAEEIAKGFFVIFEHDQGLFKALGSPDALRAMVEPMNEVPKGVTIN